MNVLVPHECPLLCSVFAHLPQDLSRMMGDTKKRLHVADKMISQIPAL